MPVDASDTRERLLQAGLRFFAEHGIHGAQMRDVVREAGQANDSAVHYHFGSRDGLLLAICEQQIARMEQPRLARLTAQADRPGSPDLATAVADLVLPTAILLRAAEGRQFLKIMAQLASLSGVRTGMMPAPIAGTALSAQLAQIQACTDRALPPKVRRERLAFLIGALTSSLADRARSIDAGARQGLGHDVYVANLTAMLVAALGAPGGDTAQAKRSTDPRTTRTGRPGRSTRRP
jgi:AcrR family transcriptional regulator